MQIIKAKGKTNLLFWIAVIFEAEYQWVLAGFESTFGDGLNNLLCREVIDHSVTMGDVGLLFTIPKVEFNASGNACIYINELVR